MLFLEMHHLIKLIIPFQKKNKIEGKDIQQVYNFVRSQQKKSINEGQINDKQISDAHAVEVSKRNMDDQLSDIFNSKSCKNKIVLLAPDTGMKLSKTEKK
jgi:hypothetical protein